jgi:hypothetical protein
VKAFLFAHSSATPPESVYEILNSTRAVSTWASPFPYSAILLSNLSVSELSAVLQTHLYGIWFILIEATSENCNGWLPAQFWEYINDPGKAYSAKLFADLAKAYMASPQLPRKGLPSLQDLLGLGKGKET